MKVLLGMSGGVDSSVAAAILQKQGITVIGATIKTWSSNECRDEKAKGCCSIKDVTDARLVAGRLGIPYYVLDLADDFKEKVIDNFVQTYLSGQTPNPCMWPQAIMQGLLTILKEIGMQFKRALIKARIKVMFYLV
jgi:tRNA-specific 2-thiouridylase